uniref:Protein SEC13 homolog n=1 Tax=Eptatretus burgeri TaxID=7764 RepID=A0A8C4PX67_EPTBU
MVSVINSVETSHEDMIHDAQMDYYGNRLATCSSDRTVKIFNIRDGAQTLVAHLHGHDGPVWQVAWAHAMYGSVLASCAYDRKVIIWQEGKHEWEKIHEYKGHDSSVNSVSWGPSEFGLLLVCGSSDGGISVLQRAADGRWEAQKINNAHTSFPIHEDHLQLVNLMLISSRWDAGFIPPHLHCLYCFATGIPGALFLLQMQEQEIPKSLQIGCNAVSWGPAVSIGSLFGQSPQYIKQFVSGGCDNLVKVWREEDGQWKEEVKLESHSDWVRDVAWAPFIGLPICTIASCSQDGRVFIWRSTGSSWTPKLLHKFNDVVWHVSWSITGNILAVSGGDNRVTLWKESVDGQWACVSDVNKGDDSGLRSSI